ncbi:MAG: PAAR domain-containing protein [Novosphingobium sp.]
MGQPAARVTDMHVCPMVTGVVPHVGGPILPPCAVTVFTGKLPQARVGDMLTCVGPPDMIAKGSMTVIVKGQPAARMFDMTAHGGTIMKGEFTVLIGDSSDGGGGAGGGAYVGPMGLEGGDVVAAAQAAAMIQAAKEGKPFCEQCLKAALQRAYGPPASGQG